jgi:lactate permease
MRQLKFSIITIASVLAFAYLVNASGISITIASMLASTGPLFPFFAPVLGWLGVFITGSDTSANALFGKLQYETAVSIGVDPAITVASNVSGGVVGKMISPQSIAVAAAAGQLVGKESELFRFTVKHSFIMLLFISIIVALQAYVFKNSVPEYTMADKIVVPPSLTALNQGYLYLSVVAITVILFSLAIIFFTRAKAGAGHVQDVNVK